MTQFQCPGCFKSRGKVVDDAGTAYCVRCGIVFEDIAPDEEPLRFGNHQGAGRAKQTQSIRIRLEQ